MKKIISAIAFLACYISAHSQAVPDTIYIYETVIVYDTIVIRDTVRIKRAMNMPILQPKEITANLSPSTKNLFLQPTEKLFSQPTATISENNIIYHENKNQKKVKIMNMNENKKLNWNWNLTSYLSAALLSAQSITGMLAQETNPTEENNLPLMPVQISFVYPMTSMGKQTIDYRYTVSFNMLTGKVGAVKGVEFGGIYNYVEHDLKGVQFGGIGNKTQKVNGVQFGGITNTATTVQGVQFGGIINVSGGVHGIQFGGIANFSDSIRGIQFGGIANHSKKVDGVQFGGIANITENAKGVQIGGIVNLSENSDGIQIAGIANVSREISGVSVGGIFNRTGTLRGVQIGGIVNIVDTVESGISISLINIVRKGAYKEWSLNFADYMNVGLSFKTGLQKCYMIFTAGANLLEDNLWITGFGIGNRTPIGSRFDIQPEIVGYHYYPLNFRNIGNNTSTHLKCGFIWKLNDKFGISVAPTIYYYNANLDKIKKISTIPPIFEFDWERNKNRHTHETIRNSFGVGISVGLLM